MLHNKMTMLILSCDKYSDLWDGHVSQLEKFWGDRGFQTYIVTDKPTEKHYENVSIVSAGEELEFSERIAFALQHVQTEYVFITLDDYFLVEKIDSDKITFLLEMMNKENVDYVRLFKHPKKSQGKRLSGYKKLYTIKTERVYSVNLYSGIWRKSFMLKTFQKPRNAWKYEVSLAKTATTENAKCIVSLRKEFKILDVVRKGKILNKAHRYFKRHGVYYGDREVCSRWYEFKLGARTLFGRCMPDFVVNWARKIMIKRGHHFYSQDQD